VAADPEALILLLVGFAFELLQPANTPNDNVAIIIAGRTFLIIFIFIFLSFL
jgi:hypothetical protein